MTAATLFGKCALGSSNSTSTNYTNNYDYTVGNVGLTGADAVNYATAVGNTLVTLEQGSQLQEKQAAATEQAAIQSEQNVATKALATAAADVAAATGGAVAAGAVSHGSQAVDLAAAQGGTAAITGAEKVASQVAAPVSLGKQVGYTSEATPVNWMPWIMLAGGALLLGFGIWMFMRRHR